MYWCTIILSSLSFDIKLYKTFDLENYAIITLYQDIWMAVSRPVKKAYSERTHELIINHTLQ